MGGERRRRDNAWRGGGEEGRPGGEDDRVWARVGREAGDGVRSEKWTKEKEMYWTLSDIWRCSRVPATIVAGPILDVVQGCGPAPCVFWIAEAQVRLPAPRVSYPWRKFVPCATAKEFFYIFFLHFVFHLRHSFSFSYHCILHFHFSLHFIYNISYHCILHLISFKTHAHFNLILILCDISI